MKYSATGCSEENVSLVDVFGTTEIILLRTSFGPYPNVEFCPSPKNCITFRSDKHLYLNDDELLF